MRTQLGTLKSVYERKPKIKIPVIDHISLAAVALNVFHNGARHEPDDCTMIDLIWALGLVADARGQNFLEIVKEAVGHWYIERNNPGFPDNVDVDIDIGDPD